MKEYIEQEEMKEEVIVSGFRSDIYSCMKGALFTVIPSRWEGFGNVTIESLACGTPVLASAVGIAKEVVESKKNGLLVEPDNLESLIEGLDTMLEIAPRISSKECIRSVRYFDIKYYGERIKATLGLSE